MYPWGYTLSRNDRDSRIEGGILAYNRDGLPYCVHSDLQAPNIESCVVEINRIKARELFIFTLYKAPDRKLEQFVESLGNVLEIHACSSLSPLRACNYIFGIT